MPSPMPSSSRSITTAGRTSPRTEMILSRRSAPCRSVHGCDSSNPALRPGSSHSRVGGLKPILSGGPLSLRLNPSYGLPGGGLHPKHLLQEPRHRNLVFAVGALFGGVFRIGERVLGAAEKLQLEANLSDPQLVDEGVDFSKRRDRILGAMENEHPALDVLRCLRREVAE